MSIQRLHRRNIASPLGELVVVASKKGICLLEFSGLTRATDQLAKIEKRFDSTIKYGASFYIDQLATQLAAYFNRKLVVFDVPVDLRGTEFQCQVWDALLKIPYGETRSYQQQAYSMNRPSAVRAVANANRSNPVSILIPCHRVIGKSGELIGYGGGLDRKRFLLDLESPESN